MQPAASGYRPRRAFLADMGLGFTGLALATMLRQEARAREPAKWSPPDGRPHHPPRAKNVIWIFLSGGLSQLESFDPKPALNKYAGKTFQQTPLPDPFQSPLHDKRSRSVIQKVREKYSKIYPLQVGFKKYGQCGMDVSDWFPHIGSCVDDIAFVRNMYTTDNDHAAENQIHTGRHMLDEVQPSVGAWVTYGLGTRNENLPQFVVLGGPTRPDTRASIGACYLGPQNAGIPLGTGSGGALPYGKRESNVLEQEQRNEFELINNLNALSAVEYPQDAAIRARIRSYELAYRMQMSVPRSLDLAAETAETRKLYGVDNPTTRVAATRCLTARRLVERGVRFVQLYVSPYGVWDSHRALKKNHSTQAAKIDQPVAGLLKDLKRRGMFNDTLVVFCSEFGRTPAVEERAGGTDGRDHHPHGFTVWLAGAGIRRGFIYGATDELGFHAVEPGHYVTDLHATVLHLLGLDPRRLEVPGRKRLEIDHGQPLRGILS